jgi:glycosyltransferase involved in cell wall biosynthesis
MRIVIDLQGAQSASRFRGIGRYSLALALGVARNAGTHEVWIVLNSALPAAIGALRAAFAPFVPQERIRVFDIATPAAEMDPAGHWRTRADEAIREYFIDQLQPDAVLVTSLFEGFVDDAVCSVGRWRGGADTTVVLYDLIPFLNPDAYLATATQRAYYDRKVDSLRQAGLLLAISDYSREEAINALGLDPQRVVAISTAVDERFHPAVQPPAELAALRARFGIERDFVMYAPGGFDARKNIDGLVKAYSMLAPALRAAHQLLIASKLDIDELDRLLQLGGRLGLAEGELLLTDYVDDDTLIALYRACGLFVFPSKHEGFGLPALEAMACGAPVIGGDNTSLPEVIGHVDAMFDAADPAAIASRIAQVLGDPARRQRLREHGRSQAARFSWDATATRALRALEAHHARALPPAPAPAPAPVRRKRRLAFISPLPPERTGIADYAAQCLPALAEYFDIELVTNQPQVRLPAELAALPRRDLAWFSANAGRYDQLIYQFGNSPFHSHMFALLEQHPGVVVLHDFYLSSVLSYEQMTGAMPRGWVDALFHSHGYAAVQAAQAPANAEQAKFYFPCNLAVLQGASAVIVHSAHARALACQWYGPQAGRNWHVVPLPRSAPPAQARSRARARQALGIAADTFLVCSFGFVDATKLSHRLLEAWIASTLAADPQCELVFVGANHGGAYGQQLLDAIAAAGAGKRIRIAGWTDEAVYQQYLQAADSGVQLRSVSRGETSAAVLDCMNYGLATIVNANGAMAALPDQAVWKLHDEFALPELAEALTTLRRDPARREALGQRAAQAIDSAHRPEHSAERYRAVLDQVWIEAPRAMPALVRAVAAQLPGDEQSLQQMAHCLSFAPQRYPQPRQLLVDVTNIVQNDLRTGIERVVRMQLLELLRHPASGYRVEPVYLSNQGGRIHYRYARQYACELLGIDAVSHGDPALDINPGDVYYAPDYAPGATIEAAHAGIFDQWRARGVTLNFLIHDLLPVLQPHFFPPGAERGHAEWLACIGQQADRLVCISAAVARETRAWLAERVSRLPAIAVVHHGADIAALAAVAAVVDSAAAPQDAGLLAMLKSVPSFLMVGTIEPRKGHLQTLDAFDILWREGVEVNLVIVGNEGWKPLPAGERRTIPQTVERISRHPELGRHLFWLKGIDDAQLQQVYQASACLMASSEGEGFGLPLIEAAHFGLPIIARDIPVFREVAGEAAFYFRADEAAALARAVKDWLDLQGGHPQSTGMTRMTWAQNAEQLLAVLAAHRAPADTLD